MKSVLTITDLRIEDADEPTVLDTVLGRVLGYSRVRDVRQIIEANKVELEAYGGLRTNAANPGPKGGRPSVEYHLTEPQALLVCLFSRTAKAAAVRKQIIQVFMAWRRGELVPDGLPMHKDLVFEVIRERESVTGDELYRHTCTLDPMERKRAIDALLDERRIEFSVHRRDPVAGRSGPEWASWYRRYYVRPQPCGTVAQESEGNLLLAMDLLKQAVRHCENCLSPYTERSMI